MNISKKQVLLILCFITLGLFLTACRITTNPTPTTPTPTNQPGIQAPDITALRIIFDANNSTPISTNSRQPVLLKTNDKVTIFAQFSSDTALEAAQIFLLPADNSTAIRFDMNCNEKHECNYLWDLANPQIALGLYNLTVRAKNQEASIGADYQDTFLVY